MYVHVHVHVHKSEPVHFVCMQMALQDVSATVNADRPENGLEGLAQVRAYKKKHYIHVHVHVPPFV